MQANADSNKLHRLDAGTSSLVLLESAGLLAMAYLGPRLQKDLDAGELCDLHRPLVPHGELDAPLLEPLVSTEDGLPQRHPALVVRDASSALQVQLKLKRCDSTSDTLLFSFCDDRVGIAVTLSLTASASGVFRCLSSVQNIGERTLEISWIASASLVLSARFKEVQTNGGFWANEFQSERSLIGRQTLLFSSARGRSSHHSSPSLMIGEPGFGDDVGEVVQLAMEWSGNHQLSVAPGRSGDVCVQCGTPRCDGETVLGPGKSLTEPATLFAFSPSGINGIREQFHSYWRDRRAVKSTASAHAEHRPVHFNSWEAQYFDHTEADSKALLEQAQALGAERFVLDDGWMQGRSGPGAGLGDWVACPQRYPGGLGALADDARARGLEFGLWIEPEMLTLDSQLAQEHRAWVVATPGHQPVAGRGQYLLNLTRSDVQNYIAQTLDRLVAECRPDYLKWDMNRDYADTGGEAHAFANALVQAWYDIVDAFRRRHPLVAIEVCAAGGARADAGALLRCERLWPSDSLDPIQRFAVLRNASSVLPPAALGWHVGSSRSSTSGVATPLSTRCALATLGHMGLELDPALLDEADRFTIRYWIAFFKRERAWMATANYRFLSNPQEGRQSLLLVDQSGTRALLVLVQTQYPASGATVCLRIPGLLSDGSYTVTLLNPEDSAFVQDAPLWQKKAKFTAKGATLARLGLRQPFLQLGYCAMLQFELQK